MKLGDISWNLLKIIFLAKKYIIRAYSVSLVTGLLKVLLGIFFFIHSFCCVFNIFRFICAYYHKRR